MASAGSRRLGTKGRKRASILLDSALSVLTSEGYAAFSLRRVAVHAGVRLGHLQYYYRSKPELLRAVTQRELERRASAIENLVDTSTASGATSLPSLLAGMLDTQQDRKTIQLFGELRALSIRDAEIGELMRGYTTRYWRAIVAAFLAVNPGIRRPRAERRAALLVSLLEGLMQFRSAERPSELPLLGLERELGDLSQWLVDP